ncbi:Hypothetical protein FKW44_014190 [Caligus rogercresseyi]|uniref:Uncharacterized protein n=1 Tax=Caligus rogercresseyi TaxID=217165 RepID=A0A7T8JZR5_CALRO|nr:Hypothetical protein FKW44_014190 [Caligus rogercresseyi]
MWFDILEMNLRPTKLQNRLTNSSTPQASFPTEILSQISDVISTLGDNKETFEVRRDTILERCQSNLTAVCKNSSPEKNWAMKSLVISSNG